MLTEQDLQLFGELIDAKLDQKLDQKLTPINQRLDKMDSRLDRLEAKVDRIAEDVAVNRDALESIIEWAEKVGDAVRFPLPKL